MRDHDGRKIIQAARMNLEASRLAPEDVQTTLRVLKELANNMQSDTRTRKMAAETLLKHHQWQSDRELPIDKTVNHNIVGELPKISVTFQQSPANVLKDPDNTADSTSNGAQVIDIQGQGKGLEDLSQVVWGPA
jgi:hypothetical protein